MQKRLIILTFPASLEKLCFLCSKLSASNPAPLSLSCAHSHQPRVTLSATQGRQSEHDAKTGRKSRVASGSPKESEDLGMETIKGKPELVCNCARSPAPPPQPGARWEPGQQVNSLRWRQVASASPVPSQRTRLLGEGTPCGPGRSGGLAATGGGAVGAESTHRVFPGPRHQT